MDAKIGMNVIWVDENSSQFPALISSVEDIKNGIVDLVVFIKEKGGFRNDQVGAQYAVTPTPNCWSLIQ